ncbi:MAG: aminotransferase class I/II-fold pyridoxal phosphate-dependent enzyme [Bacteroidota bacterium]
MFKHNDIQSLENQLIKTKDKYKNKFVIIESAYSMSGDIAPLKKIIELKKKYDFFLYLDEAHTFGFYGKEGRGLASELGVLDETDFMTGTFSKSYASIGGFCVFNEKFRTFITIRSSNYLFRATFPPSAAATILATMKLFSSDSQYANSLHKKNNYMRKELLKHEFCLGNSASPIIPIFISDIDKLTKFEKEMYQKGIFAVSIIYPAVQPDEGRIRFIVNNSPTYEDIDKTVEILNQLAIKYKINDYSKVA